MLVVNTTRINTVSLLDNGCRCDGFGLRFTFLVIFMVNTTRVVTSNFRLFKGTGYWDFNGFRNGLCLRGEAGRSATEPAEFRAPVEGLDVNNGSPCNKLGNALSTCSDLRGSGRGSNGGTNNRGGQHQGGKEKSRG